MKPMHVLITGGAGFIGSHLTDTLLKRGDDVTVVDNFDPYYAPRLKWANLARAQEHDNFSLSPTDIRDIEKVNELFDHGGFDAVVHLAALAGVRESLKRPADFVDVNINGTLVLMDAARRHGQPRFVLASTSSVYGLSPHVPFSEGDPLMQCISPYGATKIACEKLAHTYYHVHDIPMVALRFFTVYGPRQRPDMAIHKFVRAILNGEEITLYGDGTSSRDYTYIDDIIAGVVAALDGTQRYDVVNLGNSATVTLSELVHVIEEACGTKAKLKPLPEQPGDPPHTCADITHARHTLGFEPQTDIAEGVARFVDWYRSEPALKEGADT